MRKMMLVAVLTAFVALMLAAAPAMAKDHNGGFSRLDGVRPFGGFNNNGVIITPRGFDNNCFNFDCGFNNRVVFTNGFNNCFNFDCGFNNRFFTPGVFNGVGQESETGNVVQNFSVNQTGSNSNQCVTPQQFGNAGSFQNAQPVLQFNSGADGFFRDGFRDGQFFGNRDIGDGFINGFGNGFGSIEPEGGNFTFAPSLSGGCTQPLQQSAAAS